MTAAATTTKPMLTPTDLALLEGYVERVFGFALKHTSNRSDAEELSQEILLQLCNAAVSTDRVENVDAWVWTIARNTWVRWLKGRGSSREDPHGDPEVMQIGGWFPEARDEEALEEMLEQERVSELLVNLSRIASQYRELAVMHYFRGMSIKEIAAATGMPEGTVKRRLHVARYRLRERMNNMASVTQASPHKLTVYTNGWGNPQKYFARAIAQSIAFAAYAKPRTVEELADELGIPAVYIEDEVGYLVDNEVMAEVGRGRFHTDFVIATLDVQRKVAREVERISNKYAPDLLAGLNAMEESIRSIGFYGAAFPWSDLLWTLVPLTSYQAHERYCGTHDVGSYKEAPKRKDGGRWYAVGFEGHESRQESPFFWRGGNNFEYTDWNGIEIRFHNAWFEGLGLRAGMLKPDEMKLIVSLVSGKSTGLETPSGHEIGPDEAAFADLIERGFVNRIDLGDGIFELSPALCVFTQPEFDQVLHTAEPLNEIFDKMITEAYDHSHALMKEHVPSRLYDQIWQFLGGFVDSLKGYVLKRLADDGAISIPKEPETSTIAMYLVYGPVERNAQSDGA